MALVNSHIGHVTWSEWALAVFSTGHPKWKSSRYPHFGAPGTIRESEDVSGLHQGCGYPVAFGVVPLKRVSVVTALVPRYRLNPAGKPSAGL